jgi:hypothetical protein
MPDRNTLPTIAVCASPPRMWPTSALVKPNRRSLMPDSFMSEPASVNSGTARSGKDCSPA